jgi:hypothetical protein
VGDRSQVINVGQVTTAGIADHALFVLGEDAAAVNLGRIEISGPDSVGMEGLDTTHLTNKGVIVATGEFDVGMAGVGYGLQISNLGSIAVHGALASGMVVRGFEFDTHSSADGTIVNRGMVESTGDGASGVLMFGDGHHLINSGRITTDGGAIDAGFEVFRAVGVLVSGDDALIENLRSSRARTPLRPLSR